LVYRGFQPSTRQLQIGTPFIDIGLVHPLKALIGHCAVIFGGHGALPIVAGAPNKLYSGYGGSSDCCPRVVPIGQAQANHR
jgi:hypothetical protein